MCLNGGLSEVMLLGFVLFCLFVGLKKKNSIQSGWVIKD